MLFLERISLKRLQLSNNVKVDIKQSISLKCQESHKINVESNIRCFNGVSVVILHEKLELQLNCFELKNEYLYRH